MADMILPIIYARMESKRFPGKVLTPIKVRQKERSMIDHCVVAMRSIPLRNVLAPVVATTTRPADDQIEQEVESAKVIRAGVPLHTLTWTREIIKDYRPTWVMRVLADNPFIDADLMTALLETVMDYVANGTFIEYATYVLEDGTPTILTTMGLTCEVIRADSILGIENTRENQEHITPDFYTGARWEAKAVKIIIPPMLRNREIDLSIDYARDIVAVARYGECMSWRQIALEAPLGQPRRKK